MTSTPARTLPKLWQVRTLGRYMWSQTKKLVTVESRSGPRLTSYPPLNASPFHALDSTPLFMCSASSTGSYFEVELSLYLLKSLSTLIRTEAMIDSGATTNFVDLAFIHSLPLKPLELLSPPVVSVDGKTLSPAGKDYCYKLNIALNKQTLANHIFRAIPMLHHLILGMLWLSATNPLINWLK